jgi:hypothetical protein
MQMKKENWAQLAYHLCREVGSSPAFRCVSILWNRISRYQRTEFVGSSQFVRLEWSWKEIRLENGNEKVEDESQNMIK